MVSIRDAQRGIAGRQTEIDQARQQAQEAKESIPETTQRQLRSGGLAGREFQRGLERRRGEVGRVEAQIAQAQRQLGLDRRELDVFLRTDAGKIQFARETGIKPREILGKIGRGFPQEVVALEYDTPFGKVIDHSPRERALQREAEVVSRLTPEELETRYAPEIERSLERAGVEFTKSSTGEINITQVPAGVTDIKVPTLFGNQTLELTTETVTVPTQRTVTSRDITPEVITQPRSRTLLETARDVILGRPTETFVPPLGAFVSSSEPSGQATGIIRTPTSVEVEGIERAQVSGSFQNVFIDVPRKIETRLFGERQPTRVERLDLSKPEDVERLRVVRESQEFLSIVDQPFNLAARGIIGISDFLAGRIEPLLPEDSPLGRPSGITRSQQEEIISTLLKFAAFEPLMRTATAQRTSQFTEVIDPKTGKRIFIRKEDVKNFLRFRQSGGTLESIGKASPFATKAARARELLAVTKPEGRAKILKVIGETFGDDFLREFATQEGIILGGTSVRTVTSTATSGSAFTGLRPVELTGITVPESAVAVTGILEGGQRDSTKTDTRTDNLLDTRTKTDTRTETRTILDLGLSPRTATTQVQESAQQGAQIQRTALQVTAASLLSLSSSTAQQQQARTTKDLVTRQGQQQQPPRRVPRRLFPLLTSEPETIPTARQQIRQLFEVFVRRKGEDVEIAEFQTLPKATQRLAKELKTTLRASGFIKRDGQKIRAEQLGLFNGDFRRSKVDPFRIVEKRGKRLSTRSEVMQIKAAPKRKRRTGRMRLL